MPECQAPAWAELIGAVGQSLGHRAGVLVAADGTRTLAGMVGMVGMDVAGALIRLLRRLTGAGRLSVNLN